MRGGYGSSGHGSLEQRIAATQERLDALPSPARHCFVDGEPSLLVEWRREPAGWEGRVISQVWLDGQGWAVVERWLPAALIVAPSPDPRWGATAARKA